jgi:hypothetical protein
MASPLIAASRGVPGIVFIDISGRRRRASGRYRQQVFQEGTFFQIAGPF